MDSGNSGSLQSSSSGGGGGDEEYDSRAESISAFLNPTAHIGHMSDPPPPHHHHLHTTTTPMFDSLSNYFDTISRPPQPPPFSTPNALLNLDMVWSKTLRSDPNYTQINPILASSTSPTVPYRPVTEVTPSSAAAAAASSDQTAHVARNPKKRSRASRRAPTTVLTTDTTNFRAMVQEFTGVPAPPFTSSPFPRTRLDLFATPSSIRSNPSSLSISQPPYLLRPFAQKLQPPTTSSLFMTNSSSSMLDHNIASTSTNNNNNNITFTCANSSTSNTSASTNNTNSQQLGLLKQSDLFLMQDPSLTFHSLLQSQPKYPLPNSSILGSKTQGSFGIQSNHSNLKMGALDEFGLGHGGGGHVNSSQLSGLPNLVCADGTPATRNDDIDPMRWGCGADTSDGNQSNLRSLNGNFDYSRNLLKGKLNSSSSASSTDFHGEKAQGNGATTRGEGMVESWICSSD
ncbi:uncharacterized protein LOC132285529 [Cornus florida]|uniref:uncharacterized protein LOC132285529 n=1 Tax=Cornus florida TaxID=4283 RepID=UPI00289F80F8|nr:uncharacterized protein LOC132285529 [Cornus florida]